MTQFSKQLRTTQFRDCIRATAAAAALCVTTNFAWADEGGLSKEATTPTPQMQAVLDALQMMPSTPITQLSAKDARKQPSATDAVMYVMKEKGIDPAPLNAMEYEKDIKIDGPAGNIPVRVYYPGNTGDQPLPVIVYYHGGGYVLATIDTYEASARSLAKGANAIVFAVEYRKAPEYKYPAAYDDAVAAYKWATMHASDYKGDNKKIAVAGESAGGALAAAVCQTAKTDKFQAPVFQLLVYPWLNNDLKLESYNTNAMAKPLNTAMIKWFTENYVDNAQSFSDPKVFPGLSKDLGGLPPAFVITASIDPLHSEGEKYAKDLKAAGVMAEYKNYPGVTHEFFGMGAVVDTAKQAEMDAAAALKKAFMTDMPMGKM